MGKLDNTLIIYISGDNGTSAEGTLEGTPNQMTAYNGILDAARGRAACCTTRIWGSDKTYPHMSVRVVVGVRHAVQVDQAGGVAFRRHAARHGHLVARPHQGRRRHPHPVPPHHRHRADDPRSHRHPGAGHGRRHRAKAHRRREHGVHVRQGERQRAVEARHAVFRDVRQPRDLPRRLVCLHDAAGAAVAAGNGASCPTINDYKWELYNLAEDFSQNNDLAAKNAGQAEGAAGAVPDGGGEIQVLPLDNSASCRARSRRGRVPSPGETVFTYTGENAGIPDRQCAEHPEQGLHDHRRDDDSRRPARKE